jgi:hypothetical protein
MSQTIVGCAGRQIRLNAVFRVNAANFGPAKSRLITNVCCIAHGDERAGWKQAGSIKIARRRWKTRADAFPPWLSGAIKYVEEETGEEDLVGKWTHPLDEPAELMYVGSFSKVTHI